MKDIRWLQKGDRIGVTAPSDGAASDEDRVRFLHAKEKLGNYGYPVVFTPHVFTADEKGRSCEAKTRGEEFNSLLEDDTVRWIISAKGGNFMTEMLPYVDYERMVKCPKWFQGYSDNTGLIHTLTTKYEIPAIYGSNFGDFGMEPWHTSISDNVQILEGTCKLQNSFDRYQIDEVVRVTGLEGYGEDGTVLWTPGNRGTQETEPSEITMEGRLLGGCLDVLIFLQGTSYDQTLAFIDKYKKDGIIWYLETFDMSDEMVMMFLWQLRQLGWFRYTKGMLFGRPLFYKEFANTCFEDAVLYALGDLDIPIIFGCDFGHRPPRLTMINGAKARVEWKKGEEKNEGKIIYI